MPSGSWLLAGSGFRDFYIELNFSGWKTFRLAIAESRALYTHRGGRFPAPGDNKMAMRNFNWSVKLQQISCMMIKEAVPRLIALLTEAGCEPRQGAPARSERVPDRSDRRLNWFVYRIASGAAGNSSDDRVRLDTPRRRSVPPSPTPSRSDRSMLTPPLDRVQAESFTSQRYRVFRVQWAGAARKVEAGMRERTIARTTSSARICPMPPRAGRLTPTTMC